jgi:hypothetical protein
MVRLYKFLNSKKATWIILIISVIDRIISINYLWFVGPDKIIAMQHSRNFLKGNGLSVTKYFSENVDIPIYDLTPQWPPGYPILLAPILKIFNYDLYWPTITIDLIAGVALIFLIRKIAVLLTFPVAAVNIITLIAGCLQYHFIYESLPTDIPAIALFLGGLLLLLQLLQSEKLLLPKLIAASVFLFLPSLFRYSYPPLSIAAPIGLMLYGWMLNKKLFIKKGIICFFLITFLTAALFIFLKYTTGSAAHIWDTGRGFFLQNLIHWTPFAFESFINSPFVTTQLVNTGGFSVKQSLNIMEMINVILVLLFLLLFAFVFIKKRRSIKDSPFNRFLWIGFFISAGTCVSLGYLSLTYRPQLTWGNYINESRYFVFVNLYLQCAFIGWVFLYNSWKKSFFQKVIVSGLFLLLFIEISHNIYLHTKVILQPTKYKFAPLEELDYVYFIDLIKMLEKNDPDAQLYVVSDNDEMYLLTANYFGHKGIYDGYKMLQNLPVVKKKTILILPLYDNQLPAYTPFLTTQHARFLNRVNEVNFYRIDIAP